MNLYMDLDNKIINEVELAALPQADRELCQRIIRFRVHVAACDGDFHRDFGSFEKAREFAKGHGWLDGSDGISRFEGFSVQLLVGGHFFEVPAMALVKAA